MPNVHRPRAGSLQFWPRKKAKRIYSRVRSWLGSKIPSLQGFAGYKAGMTHVVLKDNRPHSLTKGKNIVWPATVIECPPLKILSFKFYQNSGPYGSKLISEVFVSNKLDKSLGKKVNLPKNYDSEIKLKEINFETIDFVRGLFYTQPRLVGFARKKPEIFEIDVGGRDPKSQFDYLKNLVGKELRVVDFFKSQRMVDVHAVTKGKGFQGVVKRMGVTLKSHKSEKGQRRAVLGPEGYGKVKFSAPLAGQLGYQTRTEYNKEIIALGSNGEDVNPSGGFLNYGLIKNDYVLIKGSIPGPSKRMIRFTEPIRGRVTGSNLELKQIILVSKQ